jgi:mono/diheme cytochrome c family protein
MKKVTASLLLLFAILYACTNSVKTPLLLKPGEVAADEYTINTDRDTILVTKNGALLKIPQGSIEAGSKKQVTLEIKEAYTIAQMIKAGLTTSSGEEPMSSGGMIYINPKKGQDASIKKAIDVALPTRYKDPQMKLFKGEENSDGRINWVKPDTLPVTAYDKSIANGKAIFTTQCAPCHTLGKRASGPDLAHYLRQYSGDTLLVRGYKIHAPVDAYGKTTFADSSGKPTVWSKLHQIETNLWLNQLDYYCNQSTEFGYDAPFYPALTDADYDAIYQYIQQESDRLQLPDPQLRKLSDCLDSCKAYKDRNHELLYRKQQLEDKREKQIEENGSQTIEIRHPDTVPGVRFPPPVFNNREVVNPANPQAVYYQFSIETFGWYNIDVLLKEVIGNTKTDLSVRITGSFREKLDVFLIIPDKKIYSKGGLKNDGSGNYVFAYTDGTIYLPLQTRAFILGLTENAEGIAFGLQSFTVSSSQTVELELKSSSGEIFNKAINSLNMSDIQISVSTTINADSIRKADTELKNLKEQLIRLEQLRPKNCNCYCGNEGDSWPDEIINESQK